MNRQLRTALTSLALLLFGPLGAAEEPCADPDAGNDYPTSVRADYVLGCMLSNGKTPDVLRKCACSIDFIAAAIPYQDYERIETLIQLQQMPAVGRNAVYKSSNWSKQAVAHLREIQAESTLRCF